MITGFQNVYISETDVYTSTNSSVFYNWVVTGGTITSGQGTDTIVVLWGSAPGAGLVLVMEISGTTTLPCTIEDFAINGYTDVYAGEIDTYFVIPIAGYTYSWIVNGSATSMASSVTVNWLITDPDTINLVATRGGVMTENITVIIEDLAILGKINVSQGESENYSVPFIAGYYYTWTIVGDSSFSGQGTNSVIVIWGNVTGTGSVSVLATRIPNNLISSLTTNILFMSTQTLNPYPSLNSDYQTLLNVIKGAPPANLNALATQIANWVQTAYFPTTTPPNNFIINQIITQGASTLNGYVNSWVTAGTSGGAGYTTQQMSFINELHNGIFGIPIQSIGDFIADIEDNITRSGLLQQLQIPLLQATAVGTSAINYWNSQVQSPGGWGPYFDQNSANSAYNRMNIPYWVSAAMEGTLVGTNQAVVYGVIDPPRIAGVDLTGALVGSAMVSAAKVLFKSTKRLQNTPFASMTLSPITVGNLGGGMSADFLNSTLKGSCSHWLCGTNCAQTGCIPKGTNNACNTDVTNATCTCAGNVVGNKYNF